ncbi:MFS transporter [Campylobacter corcagiensis]|uniref:MFS transporter n=1 Tax=Campylobacter corcagiensis TaxID=1448857 RepID=A0A7M1LHU4_9BACT|nr:MFS transporter [Campylobacter corcagiensis]QKF65527.1 major facilitator superfamily transporter [Campylobacter corcagiensis]QOQ87901.1 MFS transporter [Campylobacter corcagiensis]
MIFSRNFLSICAINFTLYISSYLTLISGTNFAIKTLGASVSTAGLITLMYTLGVIFGTLYMGRIVDKISIKKTIFIVMVLDLIVSLLYTQITNVGFLLVLRAMTGTLFGMGTCICNTTISKLVPKTKRGVGIGYYNMSVIIASAISPAVAIKFNSTQAYQTSFITAAIAMAIGLLSVFFLTYKSKDLDGKKLKFSIFTLIEKTSLGVSLIMFLAGCAYGGILAFLSAHTQGLNLTNSGALYYPFYSIVALFAVWICGSVFDKFGPNLVSLATLFSLALSVFLLGIAKSSIFILASAFFLAFGWATFKSLAQSMVVKLAPSSKIGLANSTFFIAANLGIGISPPLLGFLEPSFGFSGVYIASSFIMLLAMGLYLVFVSPKFK